MKKNYHLLSARILFLVFLAPVFSSVHAGKAPVREFYQLSIYHFTTDAQEKMIDNYLQNALIPALHRMKLLKIGVFKPLANDTAADKRLYVLVPFQSLDLVTKIPAKMQADKIYQTAGAEYINAVHTTPPYTRIETILLEAFSLAPKMQPPALNSAKKERVYELRSYESATEKIYRNKVRMFNQGDEIGLFKRLNFNAIFYGEVIAGSKMPNLMYMTSFENMDDRNKHWKAFGDDPAWKKLSAMPEYKNNVSHIDITFMNPTDYSDL
ncbi:MAG: NIPSNAP family protein [Chitinophagaceae bacterium]